LTAEAIDGVFESILNSTNYLDDERCTTLGTLTFGQFGPRDLRVRVGRVVLLQGVDERSTTLGTLTFGQYTTRTHFTVKNDFFCVFYCFSGVFYFLNCFFNICGEGGGSTRCSGSRKWYSEGRGSVGSVGTRKPKS
jgi:hypothetical protein